MPITNPHTTASLNYGRRANHCYLFPHNCVSTFSNLKPGRSATLFILDFVRNHPNTTRKSVLAAYRAFYNKTISLNCFQSCLWAELITPRKYNITELGRQLLAYYNL